MKSEYHDRVGTFVRLLKCEYKSCGKEYFEDIDIFEMQEFLSINFTGGYSSVFGDMNQVECDICQSCLKSMIIGFCRISNGG